MAAVASALQTQQLHFGPDGLPAGEEARFKHEIGSRIPAFDQVVEEGWFHAESNRDEQSYLAGIHMQAICSSVDERHAEGMLADQRWTNDPDVFPDLGLKATMTSNPCGPFPPHDQQYFVRGAYDPSTSSLKQTALPSHMQDEDGNSAWIRLVDFAPCAEACHVFNSTQMTNCGRIVKGKLDNSHFIEALQAVSLRPALAKQLFYCWDLRRSVFILRLYKHGTWMRMEVDDYVPVGPPGQNSKSANVPICCRSDSFPYVLWPSLVEKAYAKLHTVRGDTHEQTSIDRGGWEALGGGGCTEEALADLTGGVAGRFSTLDVCAERLFIYIYEQQRDTLFVCRVDQQACDMAGVRLNPYYPNVVNRATVHEGKMYVQIYCGAPGVHDGGLQDLSVPWELTNSTHYPEKVKDGYFWITAHDFREYFDTIIECRLTNSGDVSLPNMPPPKVPGQLPMLPFMPGLVPMSGMAPSFVPIGLVNAPPMQSDRRYTEGVFANAGRVSRTNLPEFVVTVPDGACPCEIVCSIEQVDPRISQKTGVRQHPVPILAKVYEQISGDLYSDSIVCRSNWMPCRDAMVAFCVRQGGNYRIVAEFPDGKSTVERMIFRCYATDPRVGAAASASTAAHRLVKKPAQPKAVSWSFVGFVRQERYDNNEVQKDAPQLFDCEGDGLRRPEQDMNAGLDDFVKEVKEDCVVM